LHITGEQLNGRMPQILGDLVNGTAVGVGSGGIKPDAKARRMTSTSPARAAAKMRSRWCALAGIASKCAFSVRQLVKP